MTRVNTTEVECFACYLLTPVNPPKRLQCTYVGFTVSPTRRIRQHNGELVNGAKRTIRHRPWEMIVVVHGFPSKFHALQFEYAWQHPYSCRFTKERLSVLHGTKGLGRPQSVKRKLVELHEMLHVLPWVDFPLTVTYTNPMIQNLVRTTSFFKWPTHMTCEVQPLEHFTRFQRGNARSSASTETRNDGATNEYGDTVCFICEELLAASQLHVLTCYHEDCGVQCHSLCLADHLRLVASMENESAGDTSLLRPQRGPCPDCYQDLQWPLLVRGARPNGVRTEPSPKRRRTKRKASPPPPPTMSEEAFAPANQTREADTFVPYDDSDWFEYDQGADDIDLNHDMDAGEEIGTGLSTDDRPSQTRAYPSGVVIDLTVEGDE